jgi:hypothetical protein
MLWFITGRAAVQLIQQTKVKNLQACVEPAGHLGRLISRRHWRIQMRALSFMIALVFVLTGPSLAGSADRDMPGVGTFTYCGSPIVTPAPDVMAAISP